MATHYDLKKIRILLTEGFSEEELRLFCFDHPDFKSVLNELSERAGKTQIVQRVIEHAERRELFDPLLAWAEKKNSVRYKKHQPYYFTSTPLKSDDGTRKFSSAFHQSWMVTLIGVAVMGTLGFLIWSLISAGPTSKPTSSATTIPTITPTSSEGVAALALTPAPSHASTLTDTVRSTPEAISYSQVGPIAQIQSPSDGDEVSLKTRVSGQAANLPDDQRLWLLVQSSYGSGYYPQPEEIIWNSDDTWETMVTIGGNSAYEAFTPFTVTVALADETISSKFDTYINSWPENEYTGVVLADDSQLKTLDMVQVQRNTPLVTLLTPYPGSKVTGSETLEGIYDNLTPGIWHLYGLVETGGARFHPFGPFRPETAGGRWALEVEFPWPDNKDDQATFYALAVVAGSQVDQMLQTAAKDKKSLTNGDLDVDPYNIYRPPGKALAETTFIRSERIAFASDRAGNDDIFVINVDGSNIIRLTTDPALDTEPAWSPDGTQIAFASDRAGQLELYLMDATDGLNQRRVFEASDVPGRWPSWSPNGEWIAFHSKQNDDTDIYKVRPDGSDLTRLTDTKGEDMYPAWSPDSQSIIFMSRRDQGTAGQSELYTMDADGGNVRRLTENEIYEDDAVWSPNGQHILFVADVENTRDVYVMSADGDDIRRAADKDYDRHPSFAPDSNRFVFDSSADNRQMFLASLSNEGEPKQIETGLNKSTNPAWSPVDDRIAFVGRDNGDWEIYSMWPDGSDKTPMMDNSSNEIQPRIASDGTRMVFASDINGNFDIWLADVQEPYTWSDSPLAENSATDWQPAWSPDGNQIAFASDRDGDFDIYVMNDDGTGLQKLAGNDNQAEDSFPVWKSDTEIVFYSKRSGQGDIYEMKVSGGDARPVVENPEFDWSPAVSPDGQELVFATTRDTEGTYRTELYVLNLSTGEISRLTDNDDHDGTPLWSGDGERIYFQSDRFEGIDDVWVMEADGSNPENLTEDDRSDLLGKP